MGETIEEWSFKIFRHLNMILCSKLFRGKPITFYLQKCQYRIAPTSNPEQQWFCIPRVNILHPKSRGRSPRDEGMQYVHPRDDAKTIALGLMSEQLYCLYLHYMNEFQERKQKNSQSSDLLCITVTIWQFKNISIHLMMSVVLTIFFVCFHEIWV